MAKFVIAGNGIIALSAALDLSKKISKTDEIIIIGPSNQLGSASLAAGAMLNSFAEVTEDELKTKESLAHFKLSQEATKKWKNFEKSICENEYSSMTNKNMSAFERSGYGKGTYVIHNSTTDDYETANYNSIKKALQEFNEPFELVKPSAIPNFQPHPQKRALEALYIKNEGWFNPRNILDNLLFVLSNNPSITFYDDTIACVKAGKNVEMLIGNSGMTYHGDSFLIATGATLSKILDNSELDSNIQQIFYGVGVSIEVRLNDGIHTKAIRTPVRGGACGTYTIPYFQNGKDKQDHVLIGASNYISTEPDYHGRLISIHHLMHSATNQINMNFNDARLVRTNVGLRPISYDGYMLVGNAKFKNMFIVSGTKRDGFHLAPVISEEITGQMVGEKSSSKFRYFHPEREPIHNLDRNRAVELIVNSLMNEQFQHEFNPSSIKMLKQIKKSYYDEIHKLHDEIGAVDWGIPLHMVNMFKRNKVEWVKNGN